MTATNITTRATGANVLTGCEKNRAPGMATLADVLNSHPQLQRRLFFLARRFVAGETIDSALEAVARLNAHGLSATLDFLGEDVAGDREAAAVTQMYQTMVDRIEAAGVDANVSVKLSAVGQKISEELAIANLAAIVARARRSNMFVRLDMEGSATVDSTYRIFEAIHAQYPHIGPVVQAYLHRAESDVDRLMTGATRIRLCKGAYKEPPAVAIQRMPLIRRNYMRLAQRLLSEGNYPGIATHDEFIIAAVKSYVERHNIASSKFEFQMLYGIRSHAQREIARQGYRMRVYVPFGTHWASYFYRRLTERKENVGFIVRNLFSR